MKALITALALCSFVAASTVPFAAQAAPEPQHKTVKHHRKHVAHVKHHHKVAHHMHKKQIKKTA